MFKVRDRIKSQNQINSLKRVFQVASQHHLQTYFEIDEKNTREIEFSILIKLRNYESVDQSQDAAKYTELSGKQYAEIPG